MKKKNINNLELNKKTISNLVLVKGGREEIGSPKSKQFVMCISRTPDQCPKETDDCTCEFN